MPGKSGVYDGDQEDPDTQEYVAPEEGTDSERQSQSVGLVVSFVTDEPLRPYRADVMISFGSALGFFGAMCFFLLPTLAGIIAGTTTVDDAYGALFCALVAGGFFVGSSIWFVWSILLYGEMFCGRALLAPTVQQTEEPQKGEEDDKDDQ